MKKMIYILCLLLLCGCSETTEFIEGTETTNSNIIVVEVKGLVKYPGIYYVDEGTYLYQLIERAGGVIDGADTSKLNLVQVINANASITILGDKDEVPKLININYASYEQLLLLPGIGNALALKIIEYRENIGLFTKIEDIKLIPGIKDNVFNQIKDKITI